MIPRHLLPQIPADKIDEFIDFVRGNDIGVEFTKLPIIKLKPIQQHYNEDKVQSIRENPQAISQPIVISGGGYILDGHHRWMARKQEGLTNIPVIQCHCPIRALVEFGHQFQFSETKTVDESLT